MLAIQLHPLSFQHPRPSPSGRGGEGFHPRTYGHGHHFGLPGPFLTDPHFNYGHRPFCGRFWSIHPPSPPKFPFQHHGLTAPPPDIAFFAYPHLARRGRHPRGGFHSMRPVPCFPGHPLTPHRNHGPEHPEILESGFPPEVDDCEVNSETRAITSVPARSSEQRNARDDERQREINGHSRRCPLDHQHGPHRPRHYHPYNCRGGAFRGRTYRSRGGYWNHGDFQHLSELFDDILDLEESVSDSNVDMTKDQTVDDSESVALTSETSTIPDGDNDGNATLDKGKGKERVSDE